MSPFCGFCMLANEEVQARSAAQPVHARSCASALPCQLHAADVPLTVMAATGTFAISHTGPKLQALLLQPHLAISIWPSQLSGQMFRGQCRVQGGEHPWNTATGTVNKMGVGFKATGQFIKGNFIPRDIVKVLPRLWSAAQAEEVEESSPPPQ